jgi:hypothetical protein
MQENRPQELRVRFGRWQGVAVFSRRKSQAGLSAHLVFGFDLSQAALARSSPEKQCLKTPDAA